VSKQERELWRQVSTLLKGRPGWGLEASSTPGAPSAWCYLPHAHTRLAVSVDAGVIVLYVEDLDKEVKLPDVVVFSSWLDTNESLFAGPHPPGSEALNASLLRNLEGLHGPTP
jgi:hypothetical protein